MDTHTTMEELLDVVFPTRSALRLHIEYHQEKLVSHESKVNTESRISWRSESAVGERVHRSDPQRINK
jgi:hypothetical protein